MPLPALVSPLLQSLPGLAGLFGFGGPSKEEKAASKANTSLTRAQTVGIDQQNMFREFLRPIVQQSMLGMVSRLPAHLQGGLPQNFPQFQASINPSPFGQLLAGAAQQSIGGMFGDQFDARKNQMLARIGATPGAEQMFNARNPNAAFLPRF